MFWGLRRKFKKWEEAGLLSAEQTDAILAFERTRKAGKFSRDLTNVGVFAIFLGLVSIVAANWQGISAELKLAGHFALNAGLAFFIVRLDGEKHPIGKDFCLLALFGLFLTFIALIGQIYQLHGDLHITLLFWLAICTPFIWFYGRTYTVIAPWMTVLIITLYWNIGVFWGDLENRFLLIASVFSLYLPPLFLLIARAGGWLQRHRPGFVWTFQKMGLVLPAVIANIGMAMLYDYSRVSPDHTLHVSLLIAGLLAIAVLFYPRGADKADDATSLWYYLLFSGVLTALPFVFPDVHGGGLLSASLFIGYWIFMAWIGARIGSDDLSNWAIRLVLLRLFIVYLEVFGGLLFTGFGLIISGVILIAILKYQSRILAFGRKMVGYEHS